MSSASLHHVAFACRDPEATRHFYEDLFGFPLVHTEVAPVGDGFMRHFFFALDDGSCIAFFDLHDAGEESGWSTDVNSGLGLPMWCNHLALRATAELQSAVEARVRADGGEPLMVLDHGWCESHYYTDPNGILVELCRDAPGMPTDAEEARVLMDAVPADGTPAAETRLVDSNGR